MNGFILRKQYLEQLKQFKDDTRLVKIVTGVRRCGKSTLLNQFMDTLKETESPIVYINFEEMEFDHVRDYQDLNKHLKANIDPKIHTYIFFDEIQRIEGWERSINALMVGFDADIYITGSNAFILSSELSTYLTGRYVSINVLPFSFTEYREMYSEHNISDSDLFDLYLRYGAFPSVDPFRDHGSIVSSLSDLYSSIVYRDVMSRGQIRDQAMMERISRYLMLNNGNQISVGTISKTLGVRPETVERYLRLFEEAYIFYRVERYDIKSTALSPNSKYYSVDTGLRNSPLGYREEDIGRLLENVVFLELLRRGYHIKVGKYGDGEIDFAARNNDGVWEYYQVTYSMMSDDVRKRELKPLEDLNNSFSKTVISMDKRIPSVTESGIKHIHILDWLLS